LKRGKQTITKKISRDNIPMPSLDAFYMIDKDKGYIKLNRFSNNTYKEFLEALQSLTSKGMKKLILDLRDNGGGILEEAVDIIDELVGGDQLIVYTEGLKNPRKEYKAKRKGIFEDGEIVIMLNEGSASASEVIAGALQDLDRATIVGRRSFGKGLVQEQFTLSDGSALRLTTARYYTPLGRSIQKPYNKGIAEYSAEVIERYHQPNSQMIDSNAAKNGKFVTTIKGKKLYDGGGISPDQFVPFEKNLLDSNLNVFFRNNLLSFFAYKYFMLHQEKITAYKTFINFQSNFIVDQLIINDLIKDASIQRSSIQLNKNQEEFIKNRIKALIGRLAWGEIGMNYILNAKDLTFLKAVETLN
jgi:carboxyl-terminal processing protease